ncbi:metal-dependent hydrolase [Clostridioides difficile]|uniref:metal-dependent hydrolase n=1 Tax=Clostridioides difficile TaxID=1496 RepID=UPI002356D036|nr:metal-dependent hydrolase [Clostridioides difficile]MDM9944010.1 metal-dependent hydrolase [Clostridioides difficile]
MIKILYKTHKAGGTLAMLLVFSYMKHKGLLVDEINPFVQLTIMYPASSFGSTISDLDHAWSNVKEKTPFNYFCHYLIHLTKPIHRSWQTHSLMFVGSICILLFSVINLGIKVYGESISLILIRLILIGFISGISSHLFLDSFTRAGIQIIPGYTFKFVPNSKTFSTDSSWENLVFRILTIGIVIMLIFLLRMS